MTVTTFPSCRKRIAPFPPDRKYGNKAIPARGLEEVVAMVRRTETSSDISMNFTAQPFYP